MFRLGMGPDTTDADDERGREINAEKDGEKEFLPRLTHLHAPPALARRILPRLTCNAPPSSPPSASLAPDRPANDNANAPNINGAQKGLSGAAFARLVPDPHAKRGWHSVCSHNAEVEALAGKILAAERAGRGRHIPRKPVPVLSLSDAEAEREVVRAGVVKGRKATACAVYVRAPGLEGGASASGDGREGRAALRVLRIAVARLMYEAGAGAGGGRVGRAVGGVLAHASGLPVHRHAARGHAISMRF
ncbi:hypothetical protein DFH09DRAFT_1475541 [Mycena vulgaris]|nr:hypothetical protein DFH09DRAFT_1475541 [Mycena vulgaris]